jgi:hypothetical protein
MLIMFGILSFLISQKASRFLIPFFPFLAILLAYIILQTNYQCSIKFNRFISVLFIAGGSIVLLLQPVFRIFKPHSLMLSYYHGLWGLLPIAIGLLWWKVNSKNKINYAALIALSSCCITLLLYAIVIHMHTPDDDMHTVGTVIRQLQQTGAPVGFITTYDDRFNFAGRITQPLLYIQDLPNAARWGFQHPTGFIIQTVRKPAPKTFIPPFYQQSYRHKQVVQIWRGMDFALAHLKV